jgi:hypothetical protein
VNSRRLKIIPLVDVRAKEHATQPSWTSTEKQQRRQQGNTHGDSYNEYARAAHVSMAVRG